MKNNSTNTQEMRRSENLTFRFPEPLTSALRQRSRDTGRPLTRIFEDAVILWIQKDEVVRVQEIAEVKRTKGPNAPFKFPMIA